MQIGGNHHIKLRRVFHHLVRNVVNDQVIRFERRILFAEIFTDLLEEPFGELQNVRLARGGDLVPTFA